MTRPMSVNKSPESKPVVIRPMTDSERNASREREQANASEKS